MNKEWVDAKNKEAQEQIAKQIEEARQKVASLAFLDDEQKEILISHMCRNIYVPGVDPYDLECGAAQLMLRDGHYYDFYLDTEVVDFDGDIIITDPCYVVKKRDESSAPKWDMDAARQEWEKNNPRDWQVCNYGNNMGALGLTHFVTRSTIEGDWNCVTINTDTNKEIGKFCADAGMVAVLDLNEVLTYNPVYDGHINRPWSVTLIKNFKGSAQIVVEQEGRGFIVKVIGKGVNKVTGEPLNFTTQHDRFDDEDDEGEDDYE